MKERLIIIGAGGHGKVCADIALKMGCYKEIFFADDIVKGPVMGLQVLSGFSECKKEIGNADFFVAIGNPKQREAYLATLKEERASIATLIHPDAVIGTDVAIAPGTVVMAGAVINPDSRIGEGVILNTSCSVDHDNVIGDYCHISVGANLAGTVKIGAKTMVGAGTTIINNIEICADCMIGAGAVVVKNITEAGTYVGVPARKLK